MITIDLTLREALALLTLSLEARHDRKDSRRGLLEAETKLVQAIHNNPIRSQDAPGRAWGAKAAL